MEFITERFYFRPISEVDYSCTYKYLSLVPLSFDDLVYAILDRVETKASG